MKFDMPLRHVDVITSFYLVHTIFKGDNAAYMIFLKYKTNFNVGLYADIYRPISFIV